ncbi:tigger transposable element-derived protein 1 [Trichonephila inaurata madagascariensis]|uniref:Tigger transposable element-derived protein 1 n=1 Tax=Trichonephila inaurata madagascariensis TaxID=2747483 RepID=A0A8X6MCG2_9ARAC|nr:tigger transposable element-derived protein 1 [Trichonephila inaurata madagascariensis]
MWRSNQRAWVTQDLFKEWLFKVCVPSIKGYLDTNDLPLKSLLLLGNAPGHPKDNLLTDFPWLTIQFLPPNTNSLIQPMGQKVIAAFKKLYTRALFRRCFEACQFSSTMTLKKFWKEKFDILEAIRIIQKAWSEVTQRQLISAWRKLCPSFVQVDDERVKACFCERAKIRRKECEGKKQIDFDLVAKSQEEAFKSCDVISVLQQIILHLAIAQWKLAMQYSTDAVLRDPNMRKAVIMVEYKDLNSALAHASKFEITRQASRSVHSVREAAVTEKFQRKTKMSSKLSKIFRNSSEKG